MEISLSVPGRMLRTQGGEGIGVLCLKKAYNLSNKNGR